MPKDGDSRSSAGTWSQGVIDVAITLWALSLMGGSVAQGVKRRSGLRTGSRLPPTAA